MSDADLTKRIAEAKEKDLIAYLVSLGYDIQTETGSMAIFYSPFRNEGVASFVVSKRKNTFFDFGTRQRGDICDFVMLHERCTLPKALDIILGGEKPLPHRREIVNNAPAIEILYVGDIIDTELMVYLSQRKITPPIAEKWLKQVYIRFPYGEHPEKVYSLIGWKSDSGGFEMRTRFFKLCNSPKNITTIQGDESKIIIFEGFLDFLSYCVLHKVWKLKYKTIVLNSLSFLPPLIPFLVGKDVVLMIDNDPAADDMAELLTEAGVKFEDRRVGYREYNDINDFLCGKKMEVV